MEEGFCTILAFTTSVNKNSQSIFRGLALDFLGGRGIFAAIFSLGSFSIVTGAHPTPGKIVVPGIPGELDAYTLPLEVSLGSTPVMRCRLTVVKPVAPLTLTGGVVRAEIERVGEPDYWISVQLLAARYGTRMARPPSP
jgi:hypothetical protein